jgi:hypothetical protein
MRRSMSTLLAGCLILGGTLGSSAIKAQEAISFPDGTKFVLQLDLGALRKTEFGERLFELVREKLVNELAEESGKGEAPSMEKINDVLGFDPFEEIQRITISACDYENPEESLCAIIQMRESTGNLEGLMLALPGYDSDQYRDHQVHSASPDDDVEVYGVIHKGRSRGKRIVVSSDRSTLEMLIDQLDGRSRNRKKGTTPVETAGAIMYLRALEIPAEMMDDGPHANVARILKHLSLQIKEADEDLEVVITLAAQKPEQAEQLRQMTQGLVALLELAHSLEPDDEDLQAMMELVDRFETSQDGEFVSVSASLSSDKLLELIEQEIE